MKGIRAVVIASVVAATLGTGASWAATMRHTGAVTERPAAPSVVGTWVVGGVSFDVSEETKVQDGEAAAAPGTCVTVEYTRRGSRKRAASITSEPAARCA